MTDFSHMVGDARKRSAEKVTSATVCDIADVTYLTDEDRAALSAGLCKPSFARYPVALATVESLIVRHRAAALREAADEFAPLLVLPPLRNYAQTWLRSLADQIEGEKR